MTDVNQSDWVEADASNTSTPPNGWPSATMLPSQVEPAARAIRGAIKRWHNQISPVLTSGGSANAQTLTHTVAHAAYVKGDIFSFIAGFTNNASTTLTVDSLAALTVQYQGANLVGGEIVTGQIIVVAYDGTNIQLIARSGGIINNPTFTGTANFSAISASGTISTSVAGNIFGTPGGSTSSPTTTNTNLVLYRNSSTNWAGIGADVAGNMYFVTGISAPATRLTIDTAGGATFTGTIGASGWTVTAAGAGTFNGNMNIGGNYQIGSKPLLQISTNYTQISDPDGGSALNLGNVADSSNYYRNTNHQIQSRGGGSTFVSISSGVAEFFVPVGLGIVTGHQLQLSSDDAFKPNGGSWGNSSDKRIKTNVDYSFDAMAKIRALKPALFDWIHPGAHGGTAASGGFVAQDMLDVFPEFVSTSQAAEEDVDLVPDGKCLNLSLHNTFFGYLVKAIQELDSEVKELKAKLKQSDIRSMASK